MEKHDNIDDAYALDAVIAFLGAETAAGLLFDIYNRNDISVASQGGAEPVVLAAAGLVFMSGIATDPRLSEEDRLSGLFYELLGGLLSLEKVQADVDALLARFAASEDPIALVGALATLGLMTAVVSVEPSNYPVDVRSQIPRGTAILHLLAQAAAAVVPRFVAQRMGNHFVPATLGRTLLVGFRLDCDRLDLLDESIRNFNEAVEQAEDDYRAAALYNLGVATREQALLNRDIELSSRALELDLAAYRLADATKRPQYSRELAEAALDIASSSTENARLCLTLSLVALSHCGTETTRTRPVRIGLQACLLIALYSETPAQIAAARHIAARLSELPIDKASAPIASYQRYALEFTYRVSRGEWYEARIAYGDIVLSGIPNVDLLALDVLIEAMERHVLSSVSVIKIEPTPESEVFATYLEGVSAAAPRGAPQLSRLDLLLLWFVTIFGVGASKRVRLNAIARRAHLGPPPPDLMTLARFGLVASAANEEDFGALVDCLRDAAQVQPNDTSASIIRFLICQSYLGREVGKGELGTLARARAVAIAEQIIDSAPTMSDERWAGWGALATFIARKPDESAVCFTQERFDQLRGEIASAPAPAVPVEVRLAILAALEATDSWRSIGVDVLRSLLTADNGPVFIEEYEADDDRGGAGWSRLVLLAVRSAHSFDDTSAVLNQELGTMALRAAERLFEPELREIGIGLARAALSEDPTNDRACTTLARGLIERAQSVGDFDAVTEAVDVCTAGLAWAAPMTVIEASLYANRGVARRLRCLFTTGYEDLFDAVQDLRRACDIGRVLLGPKPTDSELRWHVSGYLSSLAVALSVASGLEESWGAEALVVAAEASDIAQSSGRAAGIDLVLSQLARHAEDADPERLRVADDALRRAEREATDPGMRFLVASEKLAIEAKTALETGDLQRQQTLLDRISEQVRLSPWTRTATVLMGLVGRLLLSLGQPIEALETLRAASSAVRSLGLAGVSEAHQNFWLRELSGIALASCGAALECGQIGVALDEVARARMVLLSSPVAEIAEAKSDLRQRYRGTASVPSSAPVSDGDPVKTPRDRRLIVLVPGDRHGWRIAVSGDEVVVEPIDRLRHDTVDDVFRRYQREYAHLRYAGQVVPADVAERFARHLAPLDKWIRDLLDTGEEIAQVKTGICLAGRLNSLPLLGATYRSPHGGVRLATVDRRRSSEEVAGAMPSEARAAVLLVSRAQEDGVGWEIVADEVRRIGDHYRSSGPVVQTLGSDLTTLRHQFESADVVHVAAHCVSDPFYPMRSWIDLGGGLRLEAQEIATWDLSRLRCLVLAACDSGIAGMVVPDEVFGFVGASLNAGVPEVVAAAFPVPSASTRDLMDRLHASLSTGASGSDALCAAQREIGQMSDEAVEGRPQDLLNVAGFETHSVLDAWLGAG